MCRWQTLKKKATKTSLKKWICVLWISITIIPTCLLCQINANSSVAEFLTVISKVRKRKKIWSWLVCVHFKTKNCSRAVTVKKCTEKCAARAKCFFAFSAYSFFDVFVVAGNFGWQLREGTRKSSGASCSKGGECCPLEKSPSSLWCNYFPQLLTLHQDQCCLTGNFFPFENVGTWRTLWTSRTSRTTWWTGTVNPIHYLWYIFFSLAAWLDDEGWGNTRNFLSCSKPSFSFFKGVARRSGTLRIIPPLYFRCMRSICIWWQI